MRVQLSTVGEFGPHWGTDRTPLFSPLSPGIVDVAIADGDTLSHAGIDEPERQQIFRPVLRAGAHVEQR